MFILTVYILVTLLYEAVAPTQNMIQVWKDWLQSINHSFGPFLARPLVVYVELWFFWRSIFSIVTILVPIHCIYFNRKCLIVCISDRKISSSSLETGGPVGTVGTVGAVGTAGTAVPTGYILQVTGGRMKINIYFKLQVTGATWKK